MNLIIAEKPSLARNILDGILKIQNAPMRKYDGYFEGGDYVVTWVFGHLFSLADIEYYTGAKTNRWTMENLPCFPREFVFLLKQSGDKKSDYGVKKQFDLIKKLCNRKDVNRIINAGDSDREGEIIVRICVEQALNGQKEFVRLWMPDQTADTIKQGLEELKDECEYQNLANEGFARTYMDWLYGVNLTRFATLKSGKLQRVGRVIVPIVKAIYDRDLEIRNFKPTKYYVMTSHEKTNGEFVDLTSKNKFGKDEFEKCSSECLKYNNQKAIVTQSKKKKTTVFPPKLFSLSKLQSFLGKKYKMSMDDSLSVVQKLYESGFVTYPRTNSEYLATAEQGKIKSIIANIAKINYPVSFRFSKSIFDDSKIESHSALTPTSKIPNPSNLSNREKKVYSAIFRRFVAVFCSEECIAEKSEIIIKVGDSEEFSLKGTVILEKGWTKFDDYTQKDKILPSLNKGDEININFKPYEKETTPPVHYTIETLNNYLKNPFKDDKKSGEESDDEEYEAIFKGLELGTEATRTGIIENACKSSYISLKKDSYYILPDGEYLIESLSKMGISMDKYKTSEMGQSLKKVYRGECSIFDSVSLAEKEIKSIFDNSKDSIIDGIDCAGLGETVGKCPFCGNDVIKTRYGYKCSDKNRKCEFSFSCYICKKNISIQDAKDLLSNGKTSLIKGFTSKNNKKFDAVLRLENGKIVFDFPNQNKSKSTENKNTNSKGRK